MIIYSVTILNDKMDYSLIRNASISPYIVHREWNLPVPVFMNYTAVKFDRKDPDTDYKVKIGKEKSALFIYNDNHQSFSRFHLNRAQNLAAGGGNAVVRPYQHESMGFQAVGIPTGPNYGEVDFTYIRYAFVWLNYVLSTHPYDKVYYSGGDMKITFNIFDVSNEIAQFISDELKKSRIIRYWRRVPSFPWRASDKYGSILVRHRMGEWSWAGDPPQPWQAVIWEKGGFLESEVERKHMDGDKLILHLYDDAIYF